jgi:hypothetical protein
MIESFLFLGGALTLTSLIANIVLFWYIKRVMGRSSLVHEVTSDMLVALEEFLEHVDHVNELPLFYGDETMKSLLAHSKEIVTYVKEYNNGFVFELGGKVDRNEEETAEEG